MMNRNVVIRKASASFRRMRGPPPHRAGAGNLELPARLPEQALDPSEDEVAARRQRPGEARQDEGLVLEREVNQDVPADDQVEVTTLDRIEEALPLEPHHTLQTGGGGSAAVGAHLEVTHRVTRRSAQERAGRKDGRS